MSQRPNGPVQVDVDVRFLLANERTLLAWVRTALTLLAAGVGLAQLGAQTGSRTALAVVVVGLGVGSAIAGTLRYVAADRALRRAALHEPGWAPVAVALIVAAVGVLVMTAVLASQV